MKDGGPAFARPIGWNGLKSLEEHVDSDDQRGMSLRDYFAAKALVGTLARPLGDGEAINAKVAAEFSYKVADAMIAARESK